MNTITLSLDKTACGLSGAKFGGRIFEEQVKSHTGEATELIAIKIVFPDHITMISSSFVQGFFRKWLEEYGAIELCEKVEVITSNEELKEIIYSNMV